MLATIARVMFPSVMPFVNMIMESEKGSGGKNGESQLHFEEIRNLHFCTWITEQCIFNSITVVGNIPLALTFRFKICMQDIHTESCVEY